MTASSTERALGTGREADLPGRHPATALRPRPGTSPVARSRGRPGRGGGAVLAEAGGVAAVFVTGDAGWERHPTCLSAVALKNCPRY